MKNYLAGAALIMVIAAWLASAAYARHLGVAAGLSQCATQLTIGDRKHPNVCTKAADNVVAAANAKAQAAARAHEQQDADAFAKADQVHQREMQDAQQKADTTIADLRTGNIKLRDYWDRCTSAASNVPATPASTGQRDATASIRTENQIRTLQYASAGRLVQLGAQADAQIRELQAILAAERRQIPAKNGGSQ